MFAINRIESVSPSASSAALRESFPDSRIGQSDLPSLEKWFSKAGVEASAVDRELLGEFVLALRSGIAEGHRISTSFSYVTPPGNSPAENLKMATGNIAFFRNLFPASFRRQHYQVLVTIPDSPYFFLLGSGKSANPFGAYLALGRETEGLRESSGVFMRFSLDTQGGALRVVRIAGVRGRAVEIKMNFAAHFGVRPEAALVLATATLADKWGCESTMVVRPEHADIVRPRKASSNMTAVAKATGFRNRTSFARWQHTDQLLSDIRQKIMAAGQHSLTALSLACDTLAAGNGEKVWKQARYSHLSE